MTEALKKASRAEGVTVYMFLLAAFKVLLHRYSGQQDLLVGGVTADRYRSEFDSLIGFFLSTVVLRTQPRGEMTFRDYLARVKDAVLGAFSNTGIPFDQLLRDVHPKRDPSRHPLFQVAFSMRPPAPEVGPCWDLTQLDIDTGTAKFDLLLSVEERPEGFAGWFLYSTDLFDALTVHRMGGHLVTLLDGVLRDPGASLHDLPLLTRGETRLVSSTFNDTRRPLPGATIHEMVVAQAARSPHAVAVSCDGRYLTYSQLNQESNRLARRLREENAGPETLIAMCVERSCDMVVSILAILKAGAAFLPIAPGLPEERRRLLLEDAGAIILLTERAQTSWCAEGTRIVYCDEGSGSSANLGPSAEPGNLAYVLYTSGSTGKPKGVEILHSSVVNFLESMRQVHAFTAADRLLAVTTISFDIAMIDVFLPLVNGGRLWLATLEDSRDPVRLVELMRQTSPTVMNATPATWRALLDAGWPGDRDLRIMCGGEAMARDLARQLLARCGVLWNGYGPTETTIGSAFHKVSSEIRGGGGAGPVPIGQPIANTQMYVLDHRRQLVPVGVKGELYIGGAGLARGYRGRPDLTCERFVEAPSVTSARLYRTGDLARWLPDGSLDCLGRADNQLKIRGFRVEPEEIEAALLEHPEVRAAAVKAWPDASGNLSLAAYVVAPSRPGVREFLEQQLPQYMVPPRVVWMENLPINEHGKVDRGRLPEPVSVVASEGYVAPSGGTERRLASIWEAVLERKGIGTHDNFFDLGGHSLLVAKLLRQVETEFGVRMSLAAVFQAPTIEQFATLLRSRHTVLRMPKLLKLQNAGSRPPLYWMHAGPAFRELAAHLGQERPFFGVAPDPDEQAALPQHPSMAQIAACLVRTIRAEQPEGPYLLGGWCASGLVAFEAASQLMAAGQEVPLLVLLDCLNPRYYFAISKRSLLASRFRYHIRNLTAQSAGEALRYGIARFGALRDHFRPPQVTDQKLISAVSNYDPKPYSGRVLLLEPAIHFDVCDVSQSWSGLLTGEVEFCAIPGNHVSWLEKSNVPYLAARIKNGLESVGRQRCGADVDKPLSRTSSTHHS